MTPIPAAVAHILTQRAPVLVLDTCSLLDLFRRDAARQQPRVPAAEIQTAAELLHLVTARPDVAQMIVPELVPAEFADHADRIEGEFEGWVRFHDQNQEWLAEAALWLGLALPAPLAVHPFGIQTSCRRLADDLLTKCVVLARDQASLDRAVARLMAKRRPSHKKEMKDSMNLEQTLELSTRLQNAGFAFARVFISSNTNDFAASPTDSRLHPDLLADFTGAGLEYYPSLRAAIGSLRARGQLP
jgi:hypothetical protein